MSAVSGVAPGAPVVSFNLLCSLTSFIASRLAAVTELYRLSSAEVLESLNCPSEMASMATLAPFSISKFSSDLK